MVVRSVSLRPADWLERLSRRSLLNLSIGDYDELCVNIKIHIVSAVLFWFSVYFFYSQRLSGEDNGILLS